MKSPILVVTSKGGHSIERLIADNVDRVELTEMGSPPYYVLKIDSDYYRIKGIYSTDGVKMEFAPELQVVSMKPLPLSDIKVGMTAIEAGKLPQIVEQV